MYMQSTLIIGQQDLRVHFVNLVKWVEQLSYPPKRAGSKYVCFSFQV